MDHAQYRAMKKQLDKRLRELDVLNTQIQLIYKHLEEHEDNMTYKTKRKCQ